MEHALSVQGLSLEELKQLLQCEVDVNAFYEALGESLASEFPGAYAELLTSAQGLRLRGLIYGLSFHPRGGELARTYLDHPEDIIVMEAIDTLRHREDWAARAQVEARSASPSEWIRSAVLRYRCALLGDASLALIMTALTDPSGRVRENAVDELDALPVPWEARVEIARPFLADEVQAVREAAAWIVEDGSGMYSQEKGAPPPEEEHA